MLKLKLLTRLFLRFFPPVVGSKSPLCVHSPCRLLSYAARSLPSMGVSRECRIAAQSLNPLQGSTRLRCKAKTRLSRRVESHRAQSSDGELLVSQTEPEVSNLPPSDHRLQGGKERDCRLQVAIEGRGVGCWNRRAQAVIRLVCVRMRTEHKSHSKRILCACIKYARRRFAAR